MIGDFMFQAVKIRSVFAELAAANRTIIAYAEYQPTARLPVEVGFIGQRGEILA